MSKTPLRITALAVALALVLAACGSSSVGPRVDRPGIADTRTVSDGGPAADVRRGDEADCCYIIKEGIAEVTIPGSAGPVTLALLEKGQYFGEEGLLIEGTRNADITMNTNGVLMRLDKADFDTLLKAPSLAMVDFSTAMADVESGKAQWIDVRLADEQERGVLKGAVCLPLQALRVKSRMLPKDRRYIVYCDTGRRSAAAAFLLGVLGYDTQILEGGLWSLMRAERDRYLVRPGSGG